MTLSLEAFRATAMPIPNGFYETTKKLWGEEMKHPLPAPEKCHYYGATVPEDGYLITTHGDQFFVHAWWYAPISYGSLEEAEKNLYQWYLEFA